VLSAGAGGKDEMGRFYTWKRLPVEGIVYLLAE